MSFVSLFTGIWDFLILLFIFTIVSYIGVKLLINVKTYLMDRFELTWTKSLLIINFFVIFIPIFSMYIYFFFFGFVNSIDFGAQLEFTMWENILLILFDSVRIIVVSLILSLMLLFFEFVGSFASEQLTEKFSPFVSEFLGVVASCALFLILFLFVFNWVPLALTVYIFFGNVNTLPLLYLIGVLT